MALKVQVGDVVFLKSGGPHMTVNQSVNESGMVECIWFYKYDGKYNDVRKEWFHYQTLDVNDIKYYLAHTT